MGVLEKLEWLEFQRELLMEELFEVPDSNDFELMYPEEKMQWLQMQRELLMKE